MQETGGNVTNTQGKRLLTHTNPKTTQMLELSHRFTGAVLTMLQKIKVNILEMSGKIDILSRDIEPKKKKQVKILELKTAITGKKCTGWAQQRNGDDKGNANKSDDTDNLQNREKKG